MFVTYHWCLHFISRQAKTSLSSFLDGRKLSEDYRWTVMCIVCVHNVLWSHQLVQFVCVHFLCACVMCMSCDYCFVMWSLLPVAVHGFVSHPLNHLMATVSVHCGTPLPRLLCLGNCTCPQTTSASPARYDTTNWTQWNHFTQSQLHILIFFKMPRIIENTFDFLYISTDSPSWAVWMVLSKHVQLLRYFCEVVRLLKAGFLWFVWMNNSCNRTWYSKICWKCPKLFKIFLTRHFVDILPLSQCT